MGPWWIPEWAFALCVSAPTDSISLQGTVWAHSGNARSGMGTACLSWSGLGELVPRDRAFEKFGSKRLGKRYSYTREG